MAPIKFSVWTTKKQVLSKSLENLIVLDECNLSC